MSETQVHLHLNQNNAASVQGAKNIKKDALRRRICTVPSCLLLCLMSSMRKSQLKCFHDWFTSTMLGLHFSACLKTESLCLQCFFSCNLNSVYNPRSFFYSSWKATRKEVKLLSTKNTMMIMTKGKSTDICRTHYKCIKSRWRSKVVSTSDVLSPLKEVHEK